MLLLILDLNGTLVHVTRRPLAHREPDVAYSGRYVYFRPHLKLFLDKLDYWARLNLVRVAVWSSVMPHNGERLMREILQFTDLHIEFALFRDQCQLLDNHGSIKDLETVWRRYPEYKAHTLIMDDSAQKLVYQPECLLHILTWSADNEEDCALLRVLDELETRL